MKKLTWLIVLFGLFGFSLGCNSDSGSATPSPPVEPSAESLEGEMHDESSHDDESPADEGADVDAAGDVSDDEGF